MQRMKILSGVALLFVLGGGVQGKAQLNPQDQALWNSVQSNNPEQVKAALLNHANVEAKDNNGDTPLLEAVSGGYADVVKVLLENHANIEAKDNTGYTALFWAISRDKADVVKLLLDNHADLEGARILRGETPLIFAAGEGHADIVKLLLENHANLEARNDDGYTPLMWAAASGKAEIVTLLLKSGANEAAKTQAGITAFDAATHNSTCDAILALEHGAQSKTLACLTALAEAYQKNPTYEYYRDVVIRTAAAAAMNLPLPEIPEAARESYVQANETYRHSQNDADIKSAIALYNDALMKAPWFSDAWYNLSLAQEKLGDYAGAVTSMKALQPLEAGGPNERRDLDRLYTLEADGKMNDTKQAQQAQLNKAAAFLQKSLGGHTVDQFWILQKQDGTLCGPGEVYSGSCYVHGSAQYGYTGHDGSAIGAQATVSTEADHVVLTLGTQRFCIPPSSVYLMQIPVVWASYSPSMHVTDCGSPPGEVRNLGFSLKAVDPVAGGKASTVDGMVMLSVEKCQDAECRHADMAVYWLKP